MASCSRYLETGTDSGQKDVVDFFVLYVAIAVEVKVISNQLITITYWQAQKERWEENEAAAADSTWCWELQHVLLQC